MVSVKRLVLRLDNGTIVSCAPGYGVTGEKQAIVIPVHEGIAKGLISTVDLEKISNIWARMESRMPVKTEVVNKRKSTPAESIPTHTKQRKTDPAPPTATTPPSAPSDWFQLATKVHHNIVTDIRSKIFREPVTAKVAADYSKIISNPMDLRTIKKKLTHHLYSCPAEFADDMDLIWANCMRYNGEVSTFGQLGMNLNQEWKRQWRKTGLDAIESAPTTSRSKRPTAGHAPTKWEPSISEPSDSRRRGGSKGSIVREKSVNAQRRQQPPVPQRPEMDEERKGLLGNALEELGDNAMEGIMDILKTTASYCNVQDDEIELDLEQLSSEELWRLDDFAKHISGHMYDPDRVGAQPRQRGPVIENASDEETDDDM